MENLYQKSQSFSYQGRSLNGKTCWRNHGWNKESQSFSYQGRSLNNYSTIEDIPNLKFGGDRLNPLVIKVEV